MVTGGSDPPDNLLMSMDEPNEEITAQWHDDLHEWYIRQDDQCSVEPARISRDVSQKRGFCSCLKRRFVSASTNIQISTPRECDSRSAAGDVDVVFSQKPSVVAWFQRCFSVSHLCGLRAPRKVASSNRTHIPAISGVCSEWFKRGGQNCNDDEDDVLVLADGWNNVLFGPCCACAEWRRMAANSIICTRTVRQSRFYQRRPRTF